MKTYVVKQRMYFGLSRVDDSFYFSQHATLTELLDRHFLNLQRFKE